MTILKRGMQSLAVLGGIGLLGLTQTSPDALALSIGDHINLPTINATAQLTPHAGTVLASATVPAATIAPALTSAALPATLPGASSYNAQPSYTIELNKGKLVRLPSPASAVMISDPDIADVQVVSPNLVYINGRRVGETNVLIIDDQDRELLHGSVSVTHNLSKLNKALSRALPGHRVQFDSIDGALVMQGDVHSPLQAQQVRDLAQPFLDEGEQLVNLLRTESSGQVTLMVRIAEVSKSELKRFGISMESLFNTGNFVFGLATGRDVVGAAGGFLRNPLDSDSLGIGLDSSDANINAIIDALETEGLVTVLAEPNLTASSGQSAEFLAGGEFPIPVVGEEDAVTITYRPFGVSLEFLPTVLSEDKISLTVSPEVSALSQIGSIQASGFNIPSITTRRASTTVELGSGQTFAIAGLLQHNTGNDIRKFPGLGDVPILGALFRSNEFRNEQTELVIMVTPYIVSPSDTRLAAPTDGFQPPSDLERILFGKLYKEDPTRTGSDAFVERALIQRNGPRLTGPAGYMMP